MPLARYFLYVGSVLLALLFIADACLPKPPAVNHSDEFRPVIRIYPVPQGRGRCVSAATYHFRNFLNVPSRKFRAGSCNNVALSFVVPANERRNT
jgi:hypothetical protein